MYKKSIFTVLAAFLFLIMFSSLTLANTITLQDSFGSTGGGEFTATTDNLGTFQTFCLEKTEYISFGTTYNYVQSFAAKYNGGAGADPISIGTAWLYAQFSKGTLVGYNFGTGNARIASANSLQYAIWYLEGEDNYLDALAAQFINQAMTGTGIGSLAALINTNGMGMYGVDVLNLTLNKTNAQDMIHYTPIPGAILLLGSGLVGLAGIRRRMSR